jgi:hypothetical protein
MLHVTNGKSAAELLKLSGFEGEVLSWDDVLHEGPVPAGLDAEALAEVRAAFIASRGWEEEGLALERFRKRDAVLDRHAREGEVVLWFEHDLYDQLQLIQILDRLAAVDNKKAVYLAQSHTYLGESGPEHFVRLFEEKLPLGADTYEIAARAWQGFTAEDPREFAPIRGEETRLLPHLAVAVGRFLEEYPWLGDGLSASQRIILKLLREGPMPLGKLFKTYQHAEDRRFMGDWSFSAVLQDLGSGDEPLLLVENRGNFAVPPNVDDPRGFYAAEAKITVAGISVCNGERDWSEFHKKEICFGGASINNEKPWRYSPEKQNIVLKDR